MHLQDFDVCKHDVLEAVFNGTSISSEKESHKDGNKVVFLIQNILNNGTTDQIGYINYQLFLMSDRTFPTKVQLSTLLCMPMYLLDSYIYEKAEELMMFNYKGDEHLTAYEHKQHEVDTSLKNEDTVAGLVRFFRICPIGLSILKDKTTDENGKH